MKKFLIAIIIGLCSVSTNTFAENLSYEDTRLVQKLVKSSIQCNANRRGGSSIRRVELENSYKDGDFYIVSGVFSAENIIVSYSGDFKGRFHKSGHLDRLQFTSRYENDWVDVDQDCLP